MALIGSSSPARLARPSFSDIVARLKTWLRDHGDISMARRVAGTAFLIRVASAALAFISQVLLARWMGSFQFGIYVYVWTWVLVVLALVDLSLASSAQRFIPEYTGRNDLARLRGFLSGIRWFSFALGCGFGLIAAAAIWLLQPWIDSYAVLPLYIACIMLPLYGWAIPQDGIARSYNWVGLALIPPYVLRQILLVVFMAAIYFGGFITDAVTATSAACVSLLLATIVQSLVLDRRLARTIAPGPKTFAFGEWLRVSLPMLVIDCFYQFLLYTDVLILSQFRPPHEVAVYYAVVKTLSIVGFVYFSVSAAASHNFTKYHVAGDRDRLAEFAANATRWTFWPSLAATIAILVVGWPMLWLFGSEYVGGYHLMFILAIGTIARASIGPGGRLLNMLGELRASALAVIGAFAINLLLCLMLIPPFGATGAAIATTTAFIVESVLLFIVTKRRVGLHIFIWRGAKARRATPAPAAGGG